MKKLTLLSLITACSVYAGGYRIPETSLNGVALGAANIAHTKSADAAYYNPANMVFMEDKNFAEVDFIHIHLDEVHYKGEASGINNLSLESEREDFYFPTIHFVSEKAGNTRLGLSITAPGGLSKRWKSQPARSVADEFTLEVIEVNPSVAFFLSENVSLALGFRIVHSEGVVRSIGPVSRDMQGDSMDYGFNLALAYKPTKELEMGFTYRSKVDLTETGTAQLDYGTTQMYDGYAELSVPLPAIAAAAVAYTFPTKTTVEFVFERNFWSTYKSLDFGYETNIGALASYFDDPKVKNWKDSNTIRIGVTQEFDKLTLMGGFVYDESPAPEATVGFELPDSDSTSVSFGARYQITDALDIGLSALYSFRDERKVSNSDLDGEFSNADVYLISTGIGYKF